MMFHHMVKLLAPTEKPTGGRRNTHSMVIGMGSLLALVIGTSLNDLTFELRDDDESALNGMARSRIRKIAPELRRPKRNPSVLQDPWERH
jgi:hypothetical protein